MPKPLNARQKLFADNILLGMSLVDAYEKAGYKRNRHAAARMITNDHIRQHIEQRQKEMEDEDRKYLESMRHDALEKLHHLLSYGQPDVTKLGAAKDILDRTGFKPKFNGDLTVEVKGWAQILEACLRKDGSTD